MGAPTDPCIALHSPLEFCALHLTAPLQVNNQRAAHVLGSVAPVWSEDLLCLVLPVIGS